MSTMEERFIAYARDRQHQHLGSLEGSISADAEPDFVQSLQGWAAMIESGALDKEDHASLIVKLRDAAFVILQLQKRRDQSAAEMREQCARWMIARSYATGHGDTLEDLLVELEGEVRERCASKHDELMAERDALKAKLRDHDEVWGMATNDLHDALEKKRQHAELVEALRAIKALYGHGFACHRIARAALKAAGEK